MALFGLDASIRVEVGWVQRNLSGVWHLDLNVEEPELTQVGVKAALDQFQELYQVSSAMSRTFKPTCAGRELIFATEAAHAPAAA